MSMSITVREETQNIFSPTSLVILICLHAKHYIGLLVDYVFIVILLITVINLSVIDTR